jgi:transposase
MDTKKRKGKRSPMKEYPETFKRKVVEEYLANGGAKTTLLAKYGIKFRSAVQTWMKQLGYEDIHKKVSYLEIKNHIELAAKYSKKPTSAQQDDAELQKRIKELERQLEDEKLRSEAYRRMIDIAERELNVPIRKKSNTR